MSATVRAARPLAPRLATARRHGISRRAERFHVDARAIQRGAQPEAPASLARRYVLLAGAAAGAAAVHGGSPGNGEPGVLIESGKGCFCRDRGDPGGPAPRGRIGEATGALELWNILDMAAAMAPIYIRNKHGK